MASKKMQDTDDRFSRVKKDPRFWEMPEREQKIKIDKRFQSMFHDKRFKLKYTVDKRGRPINHTSTEDLKRFYNLSDSEESDQEEKKAAKKTKKKKAAKVKTDAEDVPEEEQVKCPEQKGDGIETKLDKAPKKCKGKTTLQSKDEVEGSSEEEEEDDDGSEEGEEESEEDSEDESDSGPDLARGKGNIETSSDEDDEDDLTELQGEEEVEHDWGELWKDAPRGDDVTRRLAVCNMDWDRLKAKDLLALFNSFKPKGGVVLSVKIYPSEFGKERAQAEQAQGPLELVTLPEDPEKDTEQERVYREKMREYQFKRMRYFYAVVECDSQDTAAKIYEECDGYEYESSCSVVDLRFIPDDVTFDEEPKDVAADVDLASYTPKYFTSTAMATSKVELTWDETDHERVTTLNRKFKKDELLEMDFKAYLASSSEEEEEDEEEEAEQVEDKKEKESLKGHKNEAQQIAKYRELLKSIQDKDKKQQDKDMEMEITWVPGLKETAEQMVKKKMEGKDKLTPWEEFLEKKKDKKKQKKAQGKKAAAESDLSDDELPPDVDLEDPYFAEELGESGTVLKNKSKSKKKKLKGEDRTSEEEAEQEKQRAEMALLMEDDDDDERKHFNYDKIVEQQNLSKKKKKKLEKKNELLEEDHFQVDVKDPRFQAVYTSHLYNLDPSDPGFKKTKATQSIVEEKRRRREQQQHVQEEAVKRKERDLGQEGGSTQLNTSDSKKAMDPGLSMLIKSIKNKTEQFQARKKQKTK
ncbi:ESF1 protein, partial [Amia calva]|nr:ESF1 protein [Amia calva]